MLAAGTALVLTGGGLTGIFAADHLASGALTDYYAQAVQPGKILVAVEIDDGKRLPRSAEAKRILAAGGTDPVALKGAVRGAVVLKGILVMKNNKRYVLCLGYPDGGILFICGPDPRQPAILSDVFQAAVFSSPEEALAFRGLLPHQLDGAKQYGVHEWQADNYVIPV